MNFKTLSVVFLSTALVGVANAQFQPVRKGAADKERHNTVSLQATGFDYGIGRGKVRAQNGLLGDVEFNNDKWGWGFWIATDDQLLINPLGGANDQISQQWKEIHYTYFLPTNMPDTVFGASLGYMTFHYRDVDRAWIDYNVLASTALDRKEGVPSKAYLGASLGYASQVSRDLHDDESAEPFDDDFLEFEEAKTQSGLVWSVSLSYELGQNTSITASYWKFNPSGSIDITRKTVGLSFKF